MSVDYQLIAGIDSAPRAERNEDGWYTIVRDGKVERGDRITDRYRDMTFEITGFGAPFHVAGIRIEDEEAGYFSSVIIDYFDAVNNFDSFEKITACLAFLKPVRQLHSVQRQHEMPLALAAGWN